MPSVEFMNEYDDKPRSRKRGGGFLGKFIAVLLGLIIGIIAGAGGLAGIVYVVIAKTSVKKNIATISSFIGKNINYEEYISGTYADKTILELAGVTISTVQKISRGEGSLNTLNEISPYVQKIITGEKGLVNMLNGYGLDLDPAIVMDRIIVKPNGATTNADKYLTDYIMGNVNKIPVATLLQKFGYPLNGILLTICCGVEGEDFVKKADGTIQMIGDKQQMTVGEFLGSNLQNKIGELPLDCVVSIDKTDALMMALAYGNEYRYTLSNNTVTMNQVFYTLTPATASELPTLTDGKGESISIFNIQNNQLTENGTCELVLNGVTHYLKAKDTPNADGTITLLEYTTAERTEMERYKKTTISDLQSGAMSIVEDMYLGDVLQLNVNSDKVLISIAYGTEGVDYDIVTENGVKVIKPRPGHTPRTIADLKAQGSALVDGIYLKDVLNVTVNSSSMMIALAYGTKNVDYTIDTVDGVKKITPINPPRTLGDLKRDSDNLINNLQLKDVLGLNGDSDPVMLSLALGSPNRYSVDKDDKSIEMNQVYYTYDPVAQTLKTENGKEIPASDILTNDLANGKATITVDGETQYLYTQAENVSATEPFTVFAYSKAEYTDANIILYKPTTIAQLKNGTDGLLESVYLKDVLNVTAKSDSMMIALAYGTEGVDYTIDKENDEIKPINNPRTIADLKDKGSSLINELYLKDVMTLNGDSDPVMLSLAYGSPNRYTVNNDKTIIMNQVYYTYDPVAQTLKTENGTAVTIDDDIKATLAGGKATITVDGETQYLYTKAEYVSSTEPFTVYAYSKTEYTNANIILYKPTTIAQLQTGTNGLIESVYLKDVLSVTGDSDPILIALAYGTEGKDYTKSGSTITPINEPRTIADLKTQSSNLIDSVYLKDIMKEDQSNKITMYLLYGKKDVHYTIVNEAVTMSKMQVAVLDDTSITENNVYNYYGDTVLGTLSTNEHSENVFTVKGETYKLGSAVSSSKITVTHNSVEKQATLYYVLDQDGKDVLFAPTTLGDLKNDSSMLGNLTKRLTLNDVLDGVDSNTLLKSLAGKPISDLNKSVNDLTIEEVFGTLNDDGTYTMPADNPVLTALAKKKIIEIDDAVQRLTIHDIFGDTDNTILQHLSTSTLKTLDEDIEKLMFTQVFEKEIFGTPAGTQPQGVWKYLLYEKIEDPSATDIHQYKVASDMGTLINNMTRNMQHATLGMLVDDDIIEFKDPSDETKFLNAYVQTNPLDSSTKIYIHKMNIPDLLDFVMDIASVA